MQAGTAIFLIALLVVAIIFAPTVFAFIGDVWEDIKDWIQGGWDWWPDNGNQTDGNGNGDGGSGQLTNAQLTVGMVAYYTDSTFSVFATDMAGELPSYWWPMTIYSDDTGRELVQLDINVMVKVEYTGTVDRIDYSGTLKLGIDSTPIETVIIDGVDQAQDSGHTYTCKRKDAMPSDYTVRYSDNTIEYWVLNKVQRPDVPEEADWPYTDTYGNRYLHGIGAVVEGFELMVVFGDETSEVRYQGEIASDQVYCDVAFNMVRDEGMNILSCEVFSVPLTE